MVWCSDVYMYMYMFVRCVCASCLARQHGGTAAARHATATSHTVMLPCNGALVRWSSGALLRAVVNAAIAVLAAVASCVTPAATYILSGGPGGWVGSLMPVSSGRIMMAWMYVDIT